MLLSALRLQTNIERAKTTTKTEQKQRSEIVLQRCKEKLGIRRPVRIVLQSYVKTPALFGVFRPQILLPEYVETLSDEHLEYVILHELSHLKRGDSLVNILLLALQVVYWFNPLIWILFKCIREDMELANDATVLKNMGQQERRDYSLPMLEVLARCSKPALTSRFLGMVGSEKNVRRRITMIKLEKSFKKHRLFMAMAGLMVIAVTGILFLTGGTAQGDKETEWAEGMMPNRVTYLFVGVDTRPGQPDGYNTDTIALVSADSVTKTISLLSVPRDTMVYRPDYGDGKINAVAANEGVETLVAVVSEITGVKIDGYIKVNFEGCKDIIDALGGIDIHVERDMYRETGDEVDGYIDLKKGLQHLNGSEVLQYVRYRDYFDGDISRIEHQQKVMMAIGEKLLKAETILTLPQLVVSFPKGIDTNINSADWLTLPSMAKNFQGANTVSGVLPGQFYIDANGISFWKIDEDTAKKGTADLLNGIPQSLPVINPSDNDGSPVDSGP